MKNLLLSLSLIALLAGTAACQQGLKAEEEILAPKAEVTETKQEASDDQVDDTDDTDDTDDSGLDLAVTETDEEEMTRAVVPANERELVPAPRYPIDPINTAERESVFQEGPTARESVSVDGDTVISVIPMLSDNQAGYQKAATN